MEGGKEGRKEGEEGRNEWWDGAGEGKKEGREKGGGKKERRIWSPHKAFFLRKERLSFNWCEVPVVTFLVLSMQ